MQKNDETAHPNSSQFGWEQVMTGFWDTFFKPWTNWLSQESGVDQDRMQGRFGESLQANQRLWQTLITTISSPDMLTNFQKAAEMMPDMAQGFTLSSLQNFHNVQIKTGEWIKKRGEALSTADIEQLDKEFIRTITENYDKDFRRYLKIPQVGLTRFQQERVLTAIDKMNSLQLALTDFFHTLYLPIEKSLIDLQKEIAAMTDPVAPEETAKSYYNQWIKMLEGHYMELYKQPEYADLLGKVLTALNEFSAAKQEVVNDVLKQMSVPTNQDIDELSKEIYYLKKRLRKLEKP